MEERPQDEDFSPETLGIDDDLEIIDLGDEEFPVSLDFGHGITHFDDFYAILGISRRARHRAINRAFNKVMKKWSPDVLQHTGDEERIQKGEMIVQSAREARRVLLDPVQRRKYNRDLARAQRIGFPINKGGDIYFEILSSIPRGNGVLFNPAYAEEWLNFQLKDNNLDTDVQAFLFNALEQAEATSAFLNEQGVDLRLPYPQEIQTLIEHLEGFDFYLQTQEKARRIVLGLEIGTLLEPDIDYVNPLLRALLTRRTQAVIDFRNHFRKIDAGEVKFLTDKEYIPVKKFISRSTYRYRSMKVFGRIAKELEDLATTRQRVMEARLNFVDYTPTFFGDESNDSVILFIHKENDERIYPFKRVGNSLVPAENIRHIPYQSLNSKNRLSVGAAGARRITLGWARDSNISVIELNAQNGLPLNEQVKIVLAKYFSRLDKNNKKREKDS